MPYQRSARDDGLTTVVDPGGDKLIDEIKTVQCVHCGGHFPLNPPKIIDRALTKLEAEVLEEQGQRTRGFCANCNGYVCGPHCAECVPVEQMIENIEAGRPLDYKPVRSVGWSPL